MLTNSHGKRRFKSDDADLELSTHETLATDSFCKHITCGGGQDLIQLSARCHELH